ncbi:hypothetical protein H4R35_004223 [Dimargaris xerosporica]|nr:hypothetical protein H4R35_004223 [Dimargaris xerosporica]
MRSQRPPTVSSYGDPPLLQILSYESRGSTLPSTAYDPSYAEGISFAHKLSASPDSSDHAKTRHKFADAPQSASVPTSPSSSGSHDSTAIAPTPSSWALACTLVGLMTISLLGILDTTITLAALPRIGIEFGALTRIGWVPATYLLTSTVFQPLLLQIAPAAGKVPMLLASLIIFMIGSALSGAAQNIVWLIVARALAGVGVAGITALSAAIVPELFATQHQRAMYQSAHGIMFVLVSVLGPSIGGLLTDIASWRWVFYLPLPFNGLALVALACHLRLPSVTDDTNVFRKLCKVDVSGLASLVAGMICSLFAILTGGVDYPWRHAITLILLGAGVLLLLAFAGIEAVFATQPLVPLRLFVHRNAAVSLLTVLFLGMVIFTYIYGMPFYYIIVYNDSAAQAGIKLIPILLGMTLASMLGSMCASKTGWYRSTVWAGCAVAIVGVALSTRLTPSSSVIEPIGYLFLIGLGCGFCSQPLLATAQAAVKEAEVVQVTACYGFFQNAGAAINMAIVFGLLNNSHHNTIFQFLHHTSAKMNALTATVDPEILWALMHGKLTLSFSDGLHLVFILACVLIGAATLCSFGLQSAPSKQSEEK